MITKRCDVINQIMNDFLDSNGFDCSAEMANDFSYDDDINVIYWSFIVPSLHEDMFKSMCEKELHLNYNCDVFLLSFFHELGHSETLHLITDEEWKESDEILNRLYQSKSYGLKEYKDYYKCSREIIATEWAVDYINNNADIIRIFWEKLSNEIRLFYKENDLMNDYGECGFA